MRGPAASGLALASTLLVSASTASAGGDANGFGEKHQLIVSADRLLPLVGYTNASVTATDNGQEVSNSHSGANLSLLFGSSLAVPASNLVDPHTLPRVAFDFTVIDRLTLGAALAFGVGFAGQQTAEAVAGGVKTTTKTDDPRSWVIGFTPRVGYVLPLGDHLAFWPRGGLGVYHASLHQDRTVANNDVETSVGDTLLSLDLDPQLVVVPYPHLFFTVGPVANIPLAGSRTTDTTTTAGGATRSVSVDNDISVFRIGLSASIGGWFNL